MDVRHHMVTIYPHNAFTHWRFERIINLISIAIVVSIVRVAWKPKRISFVNFQAASVHPTTSK